MSMDGGDSRELYGSLNGARFTAETRTSGLPEHDRSHFSNEWVGGGGDLSSGPVFSEFQIYHTFGANNYSTRVRLYTGVQRIDLETTIVSNVVLSALMPAQDGNGVIVRVYEAAGQAAVDVKIHFSGSVQAASEVNLMEDKLKSATFENNTIRLNLRPFEIKTFRLQMTG